MFRASHHQAVAVDNIFLQANLEQLTVPLVLTRNADGQRVKNFLILSPLPQAERWGSTVVV